MLSDIPLTSASLECRRVAGNCGCRSRVSCDRRLFRRLGRSADDSPRRGCRYSGARASASSMRRRLSRKRRAVSPSLRRVRTRAKGALLPGEDPDGILAHDATSSRSSRTFFALLSRM